MRFHENGMVLCKCGFNRRIRSARGRLSFLSPISAARLSHTHSQKPAPQDPAGQLGRSGLVSFKFFVPQDKRPGWAGVGERDVCPSATSILNGRTQAWPLISAWRCPASRLAPFPGNREISEGVDSGDSRTRGREPNQDLEWIHNCETREWCFYRCIQQWPGYVYVVGRSPRSFYTSDK